MNTDNTNQQDAGAGSGNGTAPKMNSGIGSQPVGDVKRAQPDNQDAQRALDTTGIDRKKGEEGMDDEEKEMKEDRQDATNDGGTPGTGMGSSSAGS